MTRTKQTNRKRQRHNSPPRPSRDRSRQRADHSPYSASKRRESNSERNHHRINQQEPTGKRPIFDSYLDTPNLPVKVKQLCEIIAHTPSAEVDRALDDAGFRVSTGIVEEVLKLSYAHPGAAVKFFRWAGYQLLDRHSHYSWNLVVDMLGQNELFDAMWDAIKSMQKEGLLSLGTFASVFRSYVVADKVKGAFMAFEVMDQYGWDRDITALNSLISAICTNGKILDAKEFLQVAKAIVRPDADTYAMLLEGLENKQDVVNAKRTFEEMVVEIGWDPNNLPAYDSLLNTILNGNSANGLKEAMKFVERLKDRKCYPGMKFFKAALHECVKKGDVKSAILLWDLIKENGCKPDTEMYNNMITVYLNLEDDDLAGRMLDEMVFNGVFPDSQSYNLLFNFLLNTKKAEESQSVFNEMIKNEFIPSHENCCLAVVVFVEGGDPYTAIKVWKCILENYENDLEQSQETGNILVTGLRELNWLPEAVKYANDFVDRGLTLTTETLSKVRQGLAKAGKGPLYDALFKKWQLHQIEQEKKRESEEINMVDKIMEEPKNDDLKMDKKVCRQCNKFHNGECKVGEKTCYLCKSSDHVRADCPEDEKNGEKSKTKVCVKCKRAHKGECLAGRKGCFKCGKKDHISSDCKEKRLCYVCKSPDHVKADCPQAGSDRR